MRNKSLALAVAVIVAALTATACGSSSSAPPKGGGSPDSGTPKCSDVWKEGRTLPKSYDGCTNGGTLEAAVSVGKCGLTSYADTYWAIPGQVIHKKKTPEIADDKAYAKAFAACQ